MTRARTREEVAGGSFWGDERNRRHKVGARTVRLPVLRDESRGLKWRRQLSLRAMILHRRHPFDRGHQAHAQSASRSMRQRRHTRGAVRVSARCASAAWRQYCAQGRGVLSQAQAQPRPTMRASASPRVPRRTAAVRLGHRRRQNARRSRKALATANAAGRIQRQ